MMTRLDAVNQILQAIGESPVNTLRSGLNDAEEAVTVLDRVSAEVQTKGWHCNTEYGLRLQRADDGRIAVPGKVLRIDTSERSCQINVTVRVTEDGQRFLYDIRERRFTFDNDLTVNIVWAFDFDDLTPELQMYIAAKAVREYQEAEMGSVTLDSFARRNELEKWASLQDAEAQSEDLNALTHNEYLRRATYRNRYYQYRR